MSDPLTRLNEALSDRYRIERELGEGGMATVYLAEDLRHQRQVAIKVLRPELAAVIGAERFLAEIRTTANLQHPHILPLFDSGEADGFLFYVMPCVEDETLRGKMDREKQLAVDEAVSIAKDVAEALDYAHRHDIIHRDIKPANILIHDGNPVVADFGIALAVSAAGGGRMTETGLSLGTPHYMSPEQASADRDLSNRSDIYSLGCMLYEMLAGQPPHTGPSAQSVLVRILTEQPRPLSEERRSVPAHIAAAVSKAIEKLPADRFATAGEFSEALDDRSFTYTAPMRAVTGVTTAAGTSAGDSAGPLWRRALPWMAAVAGLALGVAGWMGRANGPEAITSDVHVGDAELTGYVMLEVAPVGSTLALMARVDGERALLVRRRTETDFRVLVPSDVFYFTFSPDGESIAYTDAAENSIKRISVDGGAPVTLLETEASAGGELAWGDDGYILFYAGGGGMEDGLYRIPDIGGPAELVLAGDWPFYPRPLPDGRGYLITHEDKSIVLLEPGADSARTIIREGVHGRYIPTGHIAYGHPDGRLHVVPFDLGAMEVTGEPVPVLDDVSVRGLYAFFSVSDDGNLVYLRSLSTGSGGEDELVFMDLQTGSTEPYPLSPRDMRDPQLAPDGRRVAFLSREGDSPDGQEAWVYDLELRTVPQRLTFDGRITTLAWSPSGDRVALSRDVVSGHELLLKNPDDDSAPTDVELPEGSDLIVTDWFTPDSVLMSGPMNQGERRELWIVPVDGGEPRRYLGEEGTIWYAYVAPASDHVLYMNITGEGSELRVRRFPEAGQPIPIARRGSGVWLTEQHWSPTEPVIYYQVRHPNADTLFAAHIRYEPTFGLDSTTAVWAQDSRIGDSAPFPDGSRMLLARPLADDDEDEGEDAPQPRAILVPDWFEQLRERLGGR